ncbi:MAG: hypothetical protein Q8M08_11825 [Bacteroidales bacterium]|nr:hypothetical protein [Bacteroidales bacterium]
MNSGDENSEPIAAEIRRTLEYFGIFRYPLLPAEIHRFLSFRCGVEDILSSLEIMKTNGQVVCSRQGFYSAGGTEAWSSERVAGNQRAMAMLSRSAGFTRIISSFPFVDSVAISGSLSKYYAGENDDIDYFIITARNRMWIARSLLHLFKKLTFIPGYQHYFCMNYFIDDENMAMEDKNIYTAIELATLIPVYNPEKIARLKLRNSWLREYLPNETPHQDEAYLRPAGKEIAKHMAERAINLFLPEKVNNLLMRLTDLKWRRKWRRKGFPMEDYDRAFQTTLHISKNHPADFQKRILSAMVNKTELARV